MLGTNRHILVVGLILTVFLCLSSHSADNRNFSVKQRIITNFEQHYQASVIKGWQAFQTSYARDGLACVHCHLNHDNIKRWARAYPKVEVFDGTPYQVKGLRQVVREALKKHTDLTIDQPMALVENLVAYISWWGDGQRIKPGYSRIYLPAAEDLAELRLSVRRGNILFQQGFFGPCSHCHDTDGSSSKSEKIPIINSVATFPKYIKTVGWVMCLESFLSWHLQVEMKKELHPESMYITDLIAYLTHLAAGKKLHPGGLKKGLIGSSHEVQQNNF